MTGWNFTAMAGPAGCQYETSALVTGQIYSGLTSDLSCPTTVSNATPGGAIFDMQTAYTNGANTSLYPTSESNPGTSGGDLGGLTLTRGVYTFSGGSDNVTVSTAVTLCGGPADVFVFQIPGTLDVSADIVLTGGVLPTNVFWIVEGSGATIETTVNFSGVVLSKTLIACLATSTVTGGLYAQTAITLSSDTVQQ
jgi:hypothetical protein